MTPLLREMSSAMFSCGDRLEEMAARCNVEAERGIGANLAGPGTDACGTWHRILGGIRIPPQGDQQRAMWGQTVG
ncbi:hypothetical protein Y1Q_0005387 [Alligator mississippiensis]|uniref:Uncharacterized protein n=1 Tax=Alligator mississippiensis TaxID=8496 RepID=A0A151PE64_ALLMI|nr:hypothetical protein Y1Q_0005387 [Alligator mississippiensis]